MNVTYVIKNGNLLQWFSGVQFVKTDGPPLLSLQTEKNSDLSVAHVAYSN